METDLFGQPAPPPPEISPRTGKVVRKVVPSGHPARPGSGPEGETCGTCRHSKRLSYTRGFYKCWLYRGAWTCSRRTDVLLRDPACRFWQPATKGGEKHNEQQEMQALEEGRQASKAGAEKEEVGARCTHTSPA